MSSFVETTPSHLRQSSRMAGAFEPNSDIRDDLSHAEGMHGDRDPSSGEDSSSLLPPQFDEPSSLLQKRTEMQRLHNTTRDEISLTQEPIFNNTVLEEQEMNQRLREFESSFVPEPSQLSTEVQEFSEVDDGQTAATPFHDAIIEDNTVERNEGVELPMQQRLGGEASPSVQTAPTGFKTPTPDDQQQRKRDHDMRVDTSLNMPNTSALEQMSSSPTAARTVSRVQSMASMGGYETATEHEYPDSPTRLRVRHSDPDLTPRKSDPTSSVNTSATIRLSVLDSEGVPHNVTRRRPQYLSKRSSNARLSYDSMTSSTTETSEATVSADFALQSGGAAPDSARLKRKGRLALSRSTSLGSIASFVSDEDDGQQIKRSAATIAPELQTLEEETPTAQRISRTSPEGLLITPRASVNNIIMPTESAIANHVKDLQVPGTVARNYRAEQGQSPEKNLSMAVMTPSTKKGLTLKEHRSTVEKLGKENFDLKMKIHFLDQALQKRSEDGIKEMITENVQLKSDRMRLEKDNHTLRKQVRELQKKLDEATGTKINEDQGYGTDEERSPTVEEEVLYLRERLEVNEIEIEKLRQDNFAKETEKRRLAEMVRNLGDSRAGASEVGSREERDMWKDMLEAETISREQAEDDARKLREELAKLKQESLASNNRSKLKVVGGQVMSRSNSIDGSRAGKAEAAELERMRHEVSELQKTIGAQASALTSRNKEKEMLYQEIENLKLGRISGLRSVAGDSIWERSASRARSNSRASNGTRYTRMSDNERDSLESRIDHLRDELSQLKLDKQNLQNQFDEALAELDAVDAQAQADADQFNEEMMLLTQERDNALRDAEDQDQAFQQLKNEAQEEIDGLGDELDAKIEECARLDEELKVQAENVNALQAEMRSASEGLVRLEEDAQQNLSRYQSVKAELDDANRELETMEKNLTEAETKMERLSVQQESSRNEIAFLREEQDGDKLKIGDLESLLKKVHLNLETERDRAREFERSLQEERSQRDTVASKEKQEVQLVVNDLNRETAAHKEEVRRLKKTLSTREVEAVTFKDRLVLLENNLRQIVNDPSASSSQLIGSLSKMQADLEQATIDLQSARSRLDEQMKVSTDRDGLLESSAMEARRLTELLERERQGRRQDKHSFEQSLKSHQQAARVVSISNARIAELEQARQGHRKQLSQVEGQFKDQLAERNQVLLTIWKRLSAMCGPDWAHNHSLINGNLPSQEVIGNMLFWPGFSRNLLLAARQVEDVLTGFKEKVKRVERDLWRDFHNLEKEFDLRNRKLERIEEAWEKIKLREREIEAGLAQHGSRSMKHPELQKLKGENRLLKAEVQLLQQQQHYGLQSRTVSNSHGYAHAQSHQRAESRNSQFSTGLRSNDGQASVETASVVSGGGIPARRSSMRGNSKVGPASLPRYHSTGTVETLSNFDGTSSRSNSVASGRNGVTITNNQPITYSSKEDIRRSLIVPLGPLHTPLNGNFALPGTNALNHAGSTGNNAVNGSGTATTATSSDAGTITSKSAATEEGKWIHRLRELERRLKTEREQRLSDRSGMRKRLEERDAVNEELRKALERERSSRGWKNDHSTSGSVRSRPQTKGSVTKGVKYPDDPADEIADEVEVERLMANGEVPSRSPGIGKDHRSRAIEREKERYGLSTGFLS